MIGYQIHRLIFHCATKSFSDHVVPPATLAINANLDMVAFQEIGEFKTGELAALIDIRDLWYAIFLNRFMNRFNTEIRMHGVRELEGQDLSAVPISDCRQI